MSEDLSRFIESVAIELRRNAALVTGGTDGGPTTIEMGRVRRGTASVLVDVDVIDGGHRYPLLVKTTPPADGPPVDTRAMIAADAPRIGLWCDPESLIRYERVAMRAVERHIGRLEDPRIGAVRIFDVFHENNAIAMQRLAHPTLRTLVIRDARRIGRSADRDGLCAGFRHAGAWLKAFHSLPRLDHAIERHPDRSGLISSIEEFARYLVKAGAEGPFLEAVVARTREAVERRLPAEPPRGMGHGDYAPRNVLVGEKQRVFVIDTPGRWWFPIYLDLGYFLTGLKTIAPRVATRGLRPGARRIETFERAFLEGYFAGKTPPRETIRLYEIQSLMARWASAVHERHRAKGPEGISKRLALRLKARFCKLSLAAALRTMVREGAVRF